MIGLQANRKPALEADGIAKARDILAFRRDRDQIRRAHDLARCRNHFRCQARGQRRKGCAITGIGQQPIAKATDRQAANGGEGCLVMAVLDQPRDLIRLIRDHAFREEMRERQISQGALRGDAFLSTFRSNAGQGIAGPKGCRAREQRLQIGEDIARCADMLREGHARPGAWG